MTQIVKPEIQKSQRGLVLQALAKFWTAFNRTNKQSEKLKLLRAMANRLFGDFQLRQRISLRRKFHKKKKKFRWGDCLVCGVPAQLLHHIVQIQNGGHNHRRNMMPLCHQCHAEIHPWLKQ